MNSEIKTGFLVVADISGYTRFLADTELEHANGIIKDILISVHKKQFFIFSTINIDK